MQLGLSFSLLLAGLTTLTVQDVQALPHPPRNTGSVTLPLKRVELSRFNHHPQILLQQKINRSHRRLARMTGRSPPPDRELHARLHRRVLSVEGPEGLEKRYNRKGVPKQQAPKASKIKSAPTKAGKNGSGKSQSKAPAGTGTNGGAVSPPEVNGPAELPAVPDSVANANPPTTGNSLGLNIEANDVGYLATVDIGTPPQPYLILMDSGSADFWVGADNCQSEAGGGCGNHKFLGAQESTTFNDTSKPFAVTYGTGQVSGSIIQDNLNIAGLNLVAHTFGVATLESVDFSDDSTPFDGLMGLAQSTLSQQQAATPIEALASAGLVQHPITSYKISRLADNKNDGEITFGALDTAKFDPKTLVTLANVNPQGFWEAQLDTISVDGVDTGLVQRTAILDTGTTLIVAPPNDATAVHNAIDGAKADGQGGFTVPCNTNASVALTFGGKLFAIDPRDIAVQPVDATDPTGDCVSGIAAGAVGADTEWLVGDVFLKNAYFSTDVAKNTLSLAKLV